MERNALFTNYDLNRRSLKRLAKSSLIDRNLVALLESNLHSAKRER